MEPKNSVVYPPTLFRDINPTVRPPGYFKAGVRVWVFDAGVWLEAAVKSVNETGFVQVVCRAKVGSGYDGGFGLHLPYWSSEIWCRTGEDLTIGFLTGITDLHPQARGIWDPFQRRLIVWDGRYVGPWENKELELKYGSSLLVRGKVAAVVCRLPVCLSLTNFSD